MWPKNYDSRLTAWVDLRARCARAPLESSLQNINIWWHQTPWKPYYLHWDDCRTWPDPWQLLADDIYCDVARALGMLYTIRLLERNDCDSVQMVRAEQGNLVLVQHGKYVLNWSSDTIVNIASKQIKIQTVLEPAVLGSLIG